MPHEVFQKAVEATKILKLMEGLRAIKKGEGKGQITAKDSRWVLGSVRVDDDCLNKYPNDARWDYVIGYARSAKVIAYFVEVHGAETSDVSKLEDKLEWLRRFLAGNAQGLLAKLPHETYWVAAGRVNIPHHTPQFRKLSTTMRKAGLIGPVKSLELA